MFAMMRDVQDKVTVFGAATETFGLAVGFTVIVGFTGVATGVGASAGVAVGSAIP